MFARVSALGAAVVLTACASSAPTPAVAPAPAPARPVAAAPMAAPAPAAPTVMALEPAGKYSAVTTVNGGPVNGTITITGKPGAYTGTFVSDALPEIPVTAVTVKGQTMTLQIETPNGAATITLNFTGAAYKGMWELAGQSGEMTGKKLP